MIPPNEGKRAPFLINDYQSDKMRWPTRSPPTSYYWAQLSYAVDGVRLGGSMFGYDLDELRAGRTTVVGLMNKSIISRTDRFVVFMSSWPCCSSSDPRLYVDDACPALDERRSRF